MSQPTSNEAARCRECGGSSHRTGAAMPVLDHERSPAPSAQRCGVFLNGRVRCYLTAYHNLQARDVHRYDPDEVRKAFPRWDEDTVRAFSGESLGAPAITKQKCHAPFGAEPYMADVCAECGGNIRARIPAPAEVVKMPPRQRCPVCGGSATGDWDWDCGEFLTCDSCGHQWSFATAAPEPARLGGDDSLPLVGGRRLTEWTVAEFERNCHILVGNEQAKPDCDTRLIAVLCNAVRLAREQTDMAKSRLSVPIAAPPEIDQVIASDPALREAFEIQQPKSYVPALALDVKGIIRCRTNPREVEAMLWDGVSVDTLREWGCCTSAPDENGSIYIIDTSGEQEGVLKGWWIVKDPDAKMFWPEPPDKFELWFVTYRRRHAYRPGGGVDGEVQS